MRTTAFCLDEEYFLGFGSFEGVHAPGAIPGQIERDEGVAERFECGSDEFTVLNGKCKLIGGDLKAGHGVVMAHTELQETEGAQEAFCFVEDAQFFGRDTLAVLNA